MTCRKRKRAERLAILKEIEMLNRDRCKDCTDFADVHENNSVCECPAATRIRELGEMLMQTTPRRIEIPPIQETELTVDSYTRLKQDRYNDQYIAKHFGIGQATLGRWKKKNDLLSLRLKNGEGLQYDY